MKNSIAVPFGADKVRMVEIEGSRGLSERT